MALRQTQEGQSQKEHKAGRRRGQIGVCPYGPLAFVEESGNQMEERIADILRRNFEGAKVNLGRDARNERINGTLLWDGFGGHDFLWRQNRIFRVLRRELGAEATVISHVFTYTPNEYEQMMAV